MAISKPNYMLYHHVSSICSIMVRYCYALRGPPAVNDRAIDIEEQSVDIFHNEQLSQTYLCDINAFGEVPTLAALPLQPKHTIPDSLAITLFLSKYYPHMIPESHSDSITSLLRELHAINYYSLTFTGRPETVRGIQDDVRKRLEGTIDQVYRDALEYKLAHMEGSRVHALDSEEVEHNRQRALRLLEKLRPHLAQSDCLFGLEVPSALDAHLVVFLARMSDIGRKELVPDVFEAYLSRAMQGDAWKGIQHGSTKPPMND